MSKLCQFTTARSVVWLTVSEARSAPLARTKEAWPATTAPPWGNAVFSGAAKDRTGERSAAAKSSGRRRRGFFAGLAIMRVKAKKFRS